MKKLKSTKLIASSLIVASVLALNPIGASAERRRSSDDSEWRNSYNHSEWRNSSIDGYYLNYNGAWNTNTYKDGDVINISGTVRKYCWEHPVNGDLYYYVLELDTPANFNVITLGQRYIYNGVNEIQMINFQGSYDNLYDQVNQHVNIEGTIGGTAGNWYYGKPVVITNWIFN